MSETRVDETSPKPKRKRAAPGSRWPASVGTDRYDSNGSKLEDGAGAAAKTIVRYRLHGTQRKKVFSGEDAERDAARLESLINTAYLHGWDADENHLPVAPGEVIDLTDTPEPADASVPLLQIPAGGAPGFIDVEALVAWQKTELAANPKRKDGESLSKKPLTDYVVTLDFFAGFARYGYDDPRVRSGEVNPGDSMRVDDSTLRVTEADLIDFVVYRRSTNLRVRGQNDRREAKWAAKVEKELAAADKAGREPVIEPMPERKPERVSARSIEASCSIVRRLFHDAADMGKIDYQPWTGRVDRHVVRASPKVRTLKSLLNTQQSSRIARTLAATSRRGRTMGGKLGQIDGGRYEVMVDLARLKAPREEELAAMRLSWLELDGPYPRLAIKGAEVYHPISDGGRERVIVPLKQRSVGTTRYVELHEQPELVQALRDHVATYVAVPDPTSPDEYRRDPHLFTTECGKPIDFSNWVKSWWSPTVAATIVGLDEVHLASFNFGQLRHCAITEWLREGRTLKWCSEQQGTHRQSSRSTTPASWRRSATPPGRAPLSQSMPRRRH